MLLALLALASSLAVQTAPKPIDTKIVPQFVGVFDKDDALVCQRVTFEKPTAYGLSLAVLESLSYGKDAIDRAKEMPAAFDKSRDMMTLMTELMRIIKSSSNDYRCAQSALATINQRNADDLTRMIAQSLPFSWHQQIEVDAKLYAFTRKMGGMSQADIADQMSSLQVDRGKLWDGISPCVNMTLLLLEDDKRLNAEGNINRLKINYAQKKELIDKVTTAFPAANSANIKDMDQPTFLASLYLTLLNSKKASDEV